MVINLVMKKLFLTILIIFALPSLVSADLYYCKYGTHDVDKNADRTTIFQRNGKVMDSLGDTIGGGLAPGQKFYEMFEGIDAHHLYTVIPRDPITGKTHGDRGDFPQSAVLVMYKYVAYEDHNFVMSFTSLFGVERVVSGNCKVTYQ